MQKDTKSDLKAMDTTPPEGMTVSIGAAARILGTSSSTLKRRGAEWGLRTFWDGRGRRYSVHELQSVKEGILKPQEPCDITQDLTAVRMYDLPGGYRFRVYRTGTFKGYVGFFAFEKYEYIELDLSYALGEGTYYLKLLDENNRMTRYTFVVHLDDPDDPERQEELEYKRNMRGAIELSRILNRR